MVTKITMPRLSLSMKKGEISQWYKKEGEAVEQGEPVVEVVTEKVTYDVEAPSSGILQKIIAPADTEVSVAETIGIIGAPDEEMPVDAEMPITVKERVIASPVAKRLAREHGIDLSIVREMVHGRITEKDVQRYIDERKIAVEVIQKIPLTGIRKAVAQRVTSSAHTIPHSTITMEIDMTNAVQFHHKHKFSYNDIFVNSVARALKDFPLMNSTLIENNINVFNEINIGIAIATDKGIVVPVVRRADELSLPRISRTLKDLVAKARKGTLKEEEMSGGTFTISNLGMFGVDIFTPIINPPEAGILGIGRIVEKPIVVDGTMKIKPMGCLSLSFDHRIIDGAPAAQFLNRIKDLLEHPPQLE